MSAEAAVDGLASKTDGRSHDDLPMAEIALNAPLGKATELQGNVEKGAELGGEDDDTDAGGEDQCGSRDQQPSTGVPVSKEVQELRIRNLMGWLMTKYEASQETSVPRSAVFSHYETHCREHRWDAVNPATFGKVIRAVFPDLKTRRLGVRGQSKYHYFGIKPRISTSRQEEGQVDEEAELEAKKLIIFPLRKRAIFGKKGRSGDGDGDGEGGSRSGNGDAPRDSSSPGEMERRGKRRGSKKPSLSSGIGGSTGELKRQLNTSSTLLLTSTRMTPVETTSATVPASTTTSTSTTTTSTTATATAASAPTTMNNAPPRNDPPYHPLIPDFDEFARFVNQICHPMPEKLPSNIHPETMCGFSVLYQNHIVQLLRLIAAREFQLVEVALSMFWSHLPRDLWPCLACEEGLRIVSIADDYLFQVAIHILVPEVLEPLPLIITQSIRHFAKSLEHWMGHVFETSLPLPIVETKLDTCRRFCQVLRRRTSLNHLAQAVRAILTSPEHVTGMLKDFSALDFGALREQVQWVIPGYETFLAYMEESFRGLLFEGAELRAWVEWLESVVEQTLATQMGVDLQEAGRELMLRWSFFTTMILRDLTLRSASSFGSSALPPGGLSNSAMSCRVVPSHATAL